MVEAKRQHGFSISAVCILFVSLSIICVIIGCSSKKGKPGAGKSRPAKTGANISSIDKSPQLPKSPNLPSSGTNQTAAPRENRISIDVLRSTYSRADSSEKKIEVLQFLPDGAIDHDPCAIGLVWTAVADEDNDVALAGIELVRGCKSPEVLPVVAKAMSHSDEEVRQTAVNILSDIDDPKTGDLLAAAVSDESENIRSAALGIVRDKDEQIRFKVFEKGISSPYGDTKEDSIAMLENMGGHRAVDILIEALQDKDTEFREKVTSAISSLIDKDFGSYEEAKTWWENNKGKYDEDLSLKK